MQSGFVPGDFGEPPELWSELWEPEDEGEPAPIDTWVRQNLKVETVVKFQTVEEDLGSPSFKSKPKSTTSYRMRMRKTIHGADIKNKERPVSAAVPLKMDPPREIPTDEAYLRDRKER